MKEDKIQQQIISYLSFHARKYNFIFYAPMNEGFMMIMNAFKVPKKTIAMIMNWMRKMGFLPGVSDIVIGCNGLMYCMELKTLTGKQSKGQVLFEDNCKRCGVEYELVRSLDECVDQMRLWGIINV